MVFTDGAGNQEKWQGQDLRRFETSQCIRAMGEADVADCRRHFASTFRLKSFH